MIIKSFSPESLAEALSNKWTPAEVIQTKNHFGYFLRYLGQEGLEAASIVIEEGYISKDFLHDYAEYYVSCFQNYEKFCKRVHFFKTTMTEELLQRAILHNSELPADFWENYLGFIVVKPIPTTVIGFTLLKHYNTSVMIKDRTFWGLRDYKIHFFGHELKLPSLAFQEQDSVLSACATTAIWSMLNKASLDHHTILKSPSQITKDAGSAMSDGNRLFPNKGLDIQQICRAITNSGLVSEVKQGYVRLTKETQAVGSYIPNIFLKKFLNAHSALGIPVIVVIEVPSGQKFGLHAITVSGFRATPPAPIDPQPGTSWLAQNIDRIYAHDDQWGPFARIDLQGEVELKTPWSTAHAQNWASRVTAVIIPVFPKVRISYEDIENIVLGLDAILTIFFDRKMKHDLVWDIKIHFSEDIKCDIRGNPGLNDAEKMKRLQMSLPKYLWLASCYIGEHKVLEFTFDATDVSNGMIGKDIICYLPEAETIILQQFLEKNSVILKSVFEKRAKLHYYDFLLKNLL